MDWNKIYQVPKTDHESLNAVVANEDRPTLGVKRKTTHRKLLSQFCKSRTPYHHFTRSPVEYYTMGNINTLTCEEIAVDAIPEGIRVVGDGDYATFYQYQLGSYNYPVVFKFENDQQATMWIACIRSIHTNFASFYECIEDGEQAPDMTETLDCVKYIKSNYGSEFVPPSIQEYTIDIENRQSLPLTFAQVTPQE
jgi:hypothetical protein